MHPRIHSDPAVMMGKPVIKGTRITVEHILRELASGATIPEMLDNYPRLTTEDVVAAIEYAADQISSGSVVAAE